MNSKSSERSSRLPATNDDASDKVVMASTAREYLDSRTWGALSEAYNQYWELLQAGESISISAFCDRYPRIAARLRNQLEVDRAIGEQLSTFIQCFEEAWPRIGDSLMGFQLLEGLGRGAFSRVFLAEEQSLGNRSVVVKVCLRGEHEAQILGKLEHENIVPVYSIQMDEEQGLSVICMPWLGRTTLRSVVTEVWKGGRTPTQASELLTVDDSRGDALQRINRLVPRAIRRGSYIEAVTHVGQKIAEGLAHAHGEGVLHLDLKPSNVLLADGGCLKILDFNLASRLDAASAGAGGTAPYMSPEQARRFRNDTSGPGVNERSDIYSLGVVLYEMLTGQLPFGGGSVDDVAEKVSCERTRGEAMQRLVRTGASPPLIAIVERCLAQDPVDRFQSAADLATTLKIELTLARKTLRWAKSHRRLVRLSLASLFLLAIVVATWLVMRAPYSVRAYNRGIACYTAEEYQKSIQYLTNSLDVEPDQADALYHRACAYVELSDYHTAIRDLKAAVDATSGEDGRVHALLGYCLNCIDTHEAATTCYERAIGCGYRPTAVLNNLGVSHYKRARLDPAMQALDEAYKTGEHRDTVLRNRAWVWTSIAEDKPNSASEAIRDIGELVQRNQAVAGDYLLVASLYAREENVDWALEYLELALEYGIALELVHKNPFLADLYEQSKLSARNWQTEPAITYSSPSQLLNPIRQP